MIEWVDGDVVTGPQALDRRYVLGEPLEFGGPARRSPALADLLEHARPRLGSRVDADLAGALRGLHRRLGAGPRSTARLAALEEGRLVLVFAGQQPALAGGPLYTLHKIATAAALAGRLEEAGVPAAPAFWMAGDDADLFEAGTAFAPGPDRALRQASLPERPAKGSLAGDLRLDANAGAVHTLFSPAPALHDTVMAREGLADLGDYVSALALALFAEDGLVVVDGRLPEIGRAATPLLDRYWGAQAAVEAAANASGALFEERGLARPLHEASTASGLFAVTPGRTRRKLQPGERPRPDETISAGVLLRSFVQESLFPSAAIVLGAGELAYFLQTEAASESLGLRRSPYVARLGATWIDRTLRDELLPAGADRRAAWRSLFEDAGAVVDRALTGRLPVEQRAALEDLPRDAQKRLAPLVESSDRSIAQVAEASLAKILAQVGRLQEHLLTRARREAQRSGLALTNVAEFLRPRKALQERSYSLLWPAVHLSRGELRARLLDAANGHLDRAWRQQHEHALIGLEPSGERFQEEEPWTASCESV